MTQAISKNKNYKPTHTALKSLEGRKLITKTGTKDYRGQQFPRYWLTDEGMYLALMEGVSAERLLEKSKILYPDAKIIHCFLEIIPFFDSEFIKMSYSAVKGKGKLEPIEVLQLILSGVGTAMDVETGKRIALTLKKYPQQYEALKAAIQFMIDQLQQIIKD